MIKLERTSVMNLENALHGARNPMNSWSRSDSYVGEDGNYIIGPNDMKLAKTLIAGGSDDRKFLRQIFVSVDITAPLYWLKEFDTYKVATTANSCSTMHKIHAKEFTKADFSCENLVPRSMAVLESTIEELNFWRNIFNEGGYVGQPDGTSVYYEPKDKEAWLQMIELLPTSYNQMRTWTGNYENLLNMYHARKNHKLDEWKNFCRWIETLPYFKEMCIDLEKNIR